MHTVVDNLQDLAKEIRCLVEDLLLNHSAIYRWNEPGSSFISATGNYAWRELGEQGRQLQSKLLEVYRHFHALLVILLKEQPKDSLELLVSTDKLILSVIEQEHTWYKHPKEAFDKVEDALAKQVGLLTRLYDSSGGEPSYVLDTNALLYNPVLEKWRFDGTAKFTLILTPTVLSELDELKVTHRHETVRQKAETLIRQIKEYRRRGKLTDGVPLVNAVSNILAIATEPDMHHSFPWLDANNKDDRIIAAMVEIMRKRSRSPVILVSRDINIQNKAEFAGLPFVEPPDVV